LQAKANNSTVIPFDQYQNQTSTINRVRVEGKGWGSA